MLLSKITINNFRLIVNAELDVHRNITLIVGRNNTAKTSCMSILEKVVKNKVLSYNDYPLQRRKYAFILLAQFMRKKITYEQLCKRLPLTSIEFLIDYSLDDAEDNLGALSPFIIDVDVDTTTALVKAEGKAVIFSARLLEKLLALVIRTEKNCSLESTLNCKLIIR